MYSWIYKVAWLSKNKYCLRTLNPMGPFRLHAAINNSWTFVKLLELLSLHFFLCWRVPRFIFFINQHKFSENCLILIYIIRSKTFSKCLNIYLIQLWSKADEVTSRKSCGAVVKSTFNKGIFSRCHKDFPIAFIQFNNYKLVHDGCRNCWLWVKNELESHKRNCHNNVWKFLTALS